MTIIPAEDSSLLIKDDLQKQEITIISEGEGFSIEYAGSWYDFKDGLVTKIAFSPQEQKGKRS